MEQPAASKGAGAQTRQQKIQQLFLTHYHDLECVAFDTYPLNVWDCESVMHVLSSKLRSYKGRITSEAFSRWAKKIVFLEASRYKILEAILSQYSLVLHRAITDAMRIGAVDCAVEHDDLFWAVAYLIFARAHDLVKRGSAKLSTRLYALAEKHVRLYYQKPNARRHQLNRLRLDAGLPYNVEIVPALELAAENAEQPDQNTNQRRDRRRSL